MEKKKKRRNERSAMPKERKKTKMQRLPRETRTRAGKLRSGGLCLFALHSCINVGEKVSN